MRFCFWPGFISSTCLLLVASGLNAATLTVQTNQLGPTPTLLAYNLGHFVPLSNTSDWWRYCAVSGARIFISPDLIEATDDIPGYGDGVTDQSSFVSRKAALRADPLNTNYINWPVFTNGFAKVADHGANTLSVDYACSQLRQLGVQILAEIGATANNFPITDTNDWAGKWELWQHYYAEAFYLGRYYDVQRYQMYNEPNLSGGPTQADYLQRLQITSDAIQCALADVDRLYGKFLVPLIHAPVAAGTAISTYSTWGELVVANRHTDFLGNTSNSFLVAQNYDYHEYNSSPANFGAHVASLNSALVSDMSPEPRFLTSISEFNVHTAGTYNTLTNTLDTPSDYATFGAIVVNLVSNFCDELYVFKFSQTLYSATVPVKKNGMLFVDNTNAPYNIGGITKAGEVWRLFNRAAAPGRNRLAVTQGSGATGLSVLASYDPAAKYYHLFSANNQASAVPLTLDVTALGLSNGTPVLLQEVSESCYAGAKLVTYVTNNQIAAGTQGAYTAWKFTIPTKAQQPWQTVVATDDTMVQDGANRMLNFGGSNVCLVRNNSTNTTLRSISFVKFHVPLFYHPDAQIALLTVKASSINGGTVAAHVYALSNTNWTQNNLTWSNAPALLQNIAAGTNYTNNVITGAGQSAFIVGQIVAGATAADQSIDVTDYLRGAAGQDVAFLIVREVNFYGDAQDNDGMSIVTTEGDPVNGPRLQILRLKDSDGDGLSDEAEVNIFHTDPNNSDTDSDGVPDGQEVLIYGTNPLGTAPEAPSISVQPASQTVTAGTNVTFSVTAYGSYPLSYQWWLNTTNFLTGQTNATLTLNNVQVSESGFYSVVVSNSVDAVASSNAQLVVNPVVVVAPSGLILYEPFNEPVGVLDTNGGWVVQGGSSGNIAAGNLTVPGLPASTGNMFSWPAVTMSDRLPFGAYSTGILYYSLAIKVTDLTGLNNGADGSTPGVLCGFANGTGTSFFKLDIRTNGIAGQYNLGVSISGTTVTYATNILNVNDTVFVVQSYTFSGAPALDSGNLWINPDPITFSAATPPSVSVSEFASSGNISALDRFFFRHSGSSQPNGMLADELRVGLSWADVTPVPPPPLNIQNTGGGVKLLWPTNAPGFTLESSAGISPASWAAVTNGVAVSGTNNTVNLNPASQVQFFRLRK